MMKMLNYNLIHIVLLSLAASGCCAAVETSLSEAVSAFNEKSLSDPIGAEQPFITVDEVVAAIFRWEREPDSPVSDRLLEDFKNIAESKALPENASFESLNGYDRGGRHVFDVWSVRIRMERPNGSSYAFVLRERAVGSRSLEEELTRLSRFIEEQGVERWVGAIAFCNAKKNWRHGSRRQLNIRNSEQVGDPSA